MSFFFQKKKRTLKELKELNPSWISLKGLNFFVEYMNQRIELFLSIWLKELLQPFFFMIQIHGPFSHQRIEPSYLRDSNTWTFLKIFDSKKWTLFFRTQSFFINKKNSQNWIFLNPTHRIDFFWIEPFNFLNMTQRIEPFNFLNMTQRIEPFFQNITQRIELFDEYDSKN